MSYPRIATLLACLSLSPAILSTSGAAAPVAVGLQVPPLRYPTVVLSYDVDPSYRLELHTTHQRDAISSLTHVGLHGLRMLEPVERGPIRVRPSLGVGIEIGTIAVRIQEATSTTPTANLKLVGGVAHRPGGCSCILVAQAWHKIALQPIGLGWGASLGVRIPLGTALLNNST